MQKSGLEKHTQLKVCFQKINSYILLTKSELIIFYYVLDLIEYVLKNWPPQHLEEQEWKSKIPTLTTESTKTEQNKALVKVMRLYHPDKMNGTDDKGNNLYDDLYKVKCEEITKLLNSKYEDVKMMG